MWPATSFGTWLIYIGQNWFTWDKNDVYGARLRTDSYGSHLIYTGHDSCIRDTTDVDRRWLVHTEHDSFIRDMTHIYDKIHSCGDIVMRCVEFRAPIETHRQINTQTQRERESVRTHARERWLGKEQESVSPERDCTRDHPPAIRWIKYLSEIMYIRACITNHKCVHTRMHPKHETCAGR